MFEKCLLLDNMEFRQCAPEDIDRISGFCLRGQGFGDIICMFPVIRKIGLYLNRQLDIFSKRPELFTFDPYVNSYFLENNALQKYFQAGQVLITIPVGGETFLNPATNHLIERPAFGVADLDDSDKEITFYSSSEACSHVTEILAKYVHKKKIIIHPHISFPIRSWPERHWQELAMRLLADDFVVISVGKDLEIIGQSPDLVEKKLGKFSITEENFCDLTNQLSIHELFELIKQCELIVTVDSGPLHLANCTETPIVCIFTDVDPRFRMRFRQGSVGYRTIPVSAPCELQYCLTRSGVEDNKCKLSGEKYLCCLPSVDQVYAEVHKILSET